MKAVVAVSILFNIFYECRMMTYQQSLPHIKNTINFEDCVLEFDFFFISRESDDS